MKMRVPGGVGRIGLGFVVGLVVAMTTMPSALAVGLASYYAGNVSYLTPDGATSLGGTTAVVKRVVNRARRTITETALQPAKNPGEAPVAIVTRLSQRGKSSSFEAADDGKTFRGVLDYSGPAWKWNRWTYAIETVEDGEVTGERLSGDGELTRDGIRTTKIVTDAGGKDTLLIREELDRVSRAEYEKLKAELTGPASRTSPNP